MMGKLGSVLYYSPLLAVLFGNASAAPLTCGGTAVIPIVHAEGVAERTGDILLQCSGGTPGQVVSGNLTVFLNTAVTNRLSANNTADAVLTIDTGAGPVSSGVAPIISGPSQLTFNGVVFTISPQGEAGLRFSNIRAAANLLPVDVTGATTAIQATISFTGNTLVQTTTYQPIAYPQVSLLASTLDQIFCPQQGSGLPANPAFSNLLTALSATTRVTEGFANAFQTRQAGEDNGTRIIAHYSGFPAGSTLLVPDAIAGSDAFQPTSTGDFGLLASGGQYVPGSGVLLLVRVLNTDANGAGGTLAQIPALTGAQPVAFDVVSPVTMSNGSGIAVYEVVSSNGSIRESAQIPTFFGFPPIGDASALPNPQQSISLGPLSTVTGPSQTAPIPRFVTGSVGDDCAVWNDCNAAFRPHLSIDTHAVAADAPSGGPQISRLVYIYNSGEAPMFWTTKVAYKSGSNWIILSPASGTNNRNLVIGMYPGSLAPGSYEAVVTIDAGAAGKEDVTVRMNVGPAVPAAPKITSVTNAATFLDGPLVAGSLATIKGANLQNATVTFDGQPATIIYQSAGQINLLVPADLGSAGNAQLLVSVSGAPNASMQVSLAPASPGIFNPGILNQDSSVNSADNPALAGSIIQVFTTGLMGSAGGDVDVKIHDRSNLKPVYAGPAPGIPGLQQVNVMIPADLPATTSDIWVCTTVAGQKACSPSSRVVIRR